MNSKKTTKHNKSKRNIPNSYDGNTTSAQDSENKPPVDWQGLTEKTGTANPVIESGCPGEGKHSSRPDARDDEKVERLAAPDWRSEQPLPSARNAHDPRGENTPAELFESKETRDRAREQT